MFNKKIFIILGGVVIILVFIGGVFVFMNLKQQPGDNFSLFLANVKPEPLKVSCQANPSQAFIRTPIQFISEVSGGVSPYTYRWSNVCIGTKSICEKSFTSTGRFIANLKVTDSTRTTQNTSCQVQILNPPPLLISCTALPNPAQINQSVAFTATALGGTGSYTYSWSGVCTGTASSCQKSFSSAGTKTANLSVASGTQTKTTRCSVTILAPPVITLTANPTSIIQGQSSTLRWSATNATSRTASGGWSGTKATSGNEIVSPTTTTTYTLSCTGPGGSNSKSVTVTVTPPLTISCSASPNPAMIGQEVTFSSVISSGVPPYIYKWSNVCTGTKEICKTSFTRSGTYSTSLTIRDALNRTKTTNCAVAVRSPLQQVIENIIVLKERTPGELLTPEGTDVSQKEGNYSLQINSILNAFYNVQPDSYDFVAVFPMALQSGNYANFINPDVQGIGLSPFSIFPSAKRLKTLVTIDLYRSYSVGIPNPNPTDIQVLLHELGHTWCCFIRGLVQQNNGYLPAHWTYNIDLFENSLNYNDILQGPHWIVKNSQEYCVEEGQRVYSSLTLYLMGLLPPDAVPPIRVHDFQERPSDYIPKPGEQSNEYYNLWGPTCNEIHTFKATRIINIQDIIKINGQRQPDYTKSQKNFQVAFVVVIPYDKQIDSNFIKAVQTYETPLVDRWREATRYTSTMTILKP